MDLSTQLLASLFVPLTFAGLPNQSPLLTMMLIVDQHLVRLSKPLELISVSAALGNLLTSSPMTGMLVLYTIIPQHNLLVVPIFIPKVIL